MGRPVPDIPSEALDGVAVLQRLGCTVDAVEVTRIRRGVLRYGWASGALIGKVYDRPEAGRDGFERMHALWASDFSERVPHEVCVPRPYRYVEELRLLLMEHVPGRPLRKLVRRGRAGPDEMRRLAQALAKLHGAPRGAAPVVDVEEHLRLRCAGRVEALARDFPDLADGVHAIVARARAHEDPARFGLAHGDCHPGQIVLAEGRTWILDLDGLHVGDPAYDLAMVCLKLSDPELGGSFVDAYREAGCREALDRIPVQTALIRLKRACKRFRWQDEPDWEEGVRREVGAGTAALEAASPL